MYQVETFYFAIHNVFSVSDLIAKGLKPQIFSPKTPINA